MQAREYDLEEDVKAQSEVDETFAHALDFDRIIDPANWQAPGDYYQTMPAATRTLVNRVVGADERLRRELREIWLPEMKRAGSIRWEHAIPKYIETLQRKRLYSGQVVAADATLSKYDSTVVFWVARDKPSPCHDRRLLGEQ